MVRRRGCTSRSSGGGVAATPAGDPAATARAPAPAEERGPHRRCLATGTIGERDRLLRFVVGPDGELVPDLAARLPGRGLWLLPRRDIVERAVARRLFARAARRAVTVPAGLADRIERLLAQRCIDAIGLARRAGLAVAGLERVSRAVHRREAAVLVAALDGALGGRRKLRALGRGLPLACVLTAVELGAAFGRERAVNAALGGGPLGRRLLGDAGKLAGFRADAAVEPAEMTGPLGPARQDGGIGAK